MSPLSSQHSALRSWCYQCALSLFLPLCFSPSCTLSGGIFLALLHSFLLHCQAAAAAAAVLTLSAHNLALLATPPLSCTCHTTAQMTHAHVCVFVCAHPCVYWMFWGFFFVTLTLYQCKSSLYNLNVYSVTLREGKRRNVKVNNPSCCQHFCLSHFGTVESQYTFENEWARTIH